MGLFGGCGGNNDSWIWILVIVVLFLIFCDGGNGLNICGNSNNNDCCC